MKRISVILITALLTTSCVTYRNFPVHKINKPPRQKTVSQELVYKVQDNSQLDILGGAQALEKALRKHSIFDTVREADTDRVPATGNFLKVTIERVNPSLPALVFGYISVGLLTIPPAWSTEGGYDLRFDYYVDGNLKKTFDYEITRKWFVWLGMLPLAWVNLMTHSEKDAFRATLYQFLDDLKPHIKPKTL